MNEKLNLVELLKDCHKGTKLFSLLYGDVYFECIDLSYQYHYPVTVKSSGGTKVKVTSDGLYYSYCNGECTLFPSKDQRDWSKWHIPFKDGDIFVCSNLCGNHIAIYNNLKRSNFYGCYAIVSNDGGFNIDGICSGDAYRLATEEEKQKLFQAIKDNGYKWNAETKTLEKLIVPKFKVGDIIRKKDGTKECVITKIHGDFYNYVTSKTYKSPCFIKRERGYFPIDRQDDYELLPDKFDPKTLKPFDKVLVKQYDSMPWCADFYSYYDEDDDYVACTGKVYYDYCIPYNEETAHLVGTDKEAPEYYRYWED